MPVHAGVAGPDLRLAGQPQPVQGRGPLDLSGGRLITFPVAGSYLVRGGLHEGQDCGQDRRATARRRRPGSVQRAFRRVHRETPPKSNLHPQLSVIARPARSPAGGVLKPCPVATPVPAWDSPSVTGILATQISGYLVQVTGAVGGLYFRSDALTQARLRSTVSFAVRYAPRRCAGA
jgi:hypothetical protein